jgi:hypothetical protein
VIGLARTGEPEFAGCHDESQNQSLQPRRRHGFIRLNVLRPASGTAAKVQRIK